MRLKDYLKAHMPLLIGATGSGLIVHIIFILSYEETFHLADLLYMDILCGVIFLGSLGYDYWRKKKANQEIMGLLGEHKSIEKALEAYSTLTEVTLAKQIYDDQKRQYKKNEAEYKEKLSNMMDYTTQIIHDIKVNLAVCDMITQRIPYEEQKKLKLQIEQMKFRIEQVLYVARANHYNEDIKVEYFEIQEILKKAIKENAEFFMNKNIELDVTVQPYEILSDQKWVQYILSQILNNSSKYTGENGRVVITSDEDEKAYYLMIKDNGIGIAKEEIGRVFDKGYTGSNGRLNTKATGMGLYYAKRMAKALGIELSVNSEQGSYTEFIIAFYKQSDYILIQE